MEQANGGNIGDDDGGGCCGGGGCGSEGCGTVFPKIDDDDAAGCGIVGKKEIGAVVEADTLVASCPSNGAVSSRSCF